MALLHDVGLDVGCWSWVRPPTTQILPARIHGWYDSDLLTSGERGCVLYSLSSYGLLPPWSVTSRYGFAAGQVDQISSGVIEREAASFECSAVRIVTVLVLVNELGRND